MLSDHVRKFRVLLERSDYAPLALFVVFLGLNAVLEAVTVGMIFPFLHLVNEPSQVLHIRVLRDVYDMMRFHEPQKFLAIFGQIFLVVMLVKNIFAATLIGYQDWMVNVKSARTAERLFAGYLYGPWPLHMNRNPADQIQTVETSSIWTFSMVLVGYLSLVAEALVAIAIFVVLLMVEPLVTLVSAPVLGVIFAGFYLLVRHRLVRLGRIREGVFRDRQQCLQQALSGAKEIKVLGRQQWFLDLFAGYWRIAKRQNVEVTVLQTMPRLIGEVVVVGGILMVVVIVLWQGRDAVEITSVLGIFAVAAFRLVPSLNRVLTALANIRLASPALDNVFNDLVNAHDRADPAAKGLITPLAETIAIEDVSYTYPGREAPALKRISLTIAKGESIGFVGPSGAGKSSLVDVILGLLPPDDGRVLVDGLDLSRDVGGWQRQLGYVPQTVTLIDDTLRRNIAFGLPDALIDEARIARVVAMARLDDMVAALPEGLDTIAGDRGSRLSGGQRQRIGIARALYHDPMVLVMDEATSAIDGETEGRITAAIESIRHNKTLLIIAHRFGTVRRCDRLVVLDDGAMVDVGSFDQLMARCEAFRAIVQQAQFDPKAGDRVLL